MSTAQDLRASFEKGQAYAEISSTKDAIVRAFQVGVPVVVAWNLPIAWYWRIVAFFVMSKLVAIVVTLLRARRDRLQKLHREAHALWCEEMRAWLRQNPNATEDEQLAGAGRVIEKLGLRVSPGYLEEMDAWLRQNPDATKDEQLDEAERLIDKFGLRVSPRYSDDPAETITIEPQITPATFKEMYLKKQDFGPEAGEIVDLLVRAGIGVGKYEQHPKPPIFWRKAAVAANQLGAWLRQNPTATPDARLAKARSVVDINRLVHRSLRMS